jgi:methionyl-tRNA formyltransferase
VGSPPNERYVVAAAHSWNRRVFDDKLSHQPGLWTLVDQRAALTAERLAVVDPRYVFFLHWSWNVPREVFDAYECIGFHMTDLPYGRGGSPLQNLILRGHRTTVLTAFRIGEELDAGPIYLGAPLSLEGRAEEIYERASRLAADLVRQILQAPPTPVPQEGDVVIFRRRTPSESCLPQDASPEQLYDFIRMLDADGYPRAFMECRGMRVEFSRAALEHGFVRAQTRISAANVSE